MEYILKIFTPLYPYHESNPNKNRTKCYFMTLDRIGVYNTIELPPPKKTQSINDLHHKEENNVQ